MLAIATIALAIILAFANGANDVSKGIATLVGSGVSNYRAAVIWGALSTTAGAIAAAFGSQALVATFSGKGLLAQPAASSVFILAVAIGAIGWLIIATRGGLPVSTTHSIAGALVGAGVMLAGAGGIAWAALAGKIVLPLLASPAMAVVLLFAVLPVVRPLAARFDRYCICVEQTSLSAVTPEGVAFRESMPALSAGTTKTCRTAVARVGAIDSLHWLSAGATSFFRGLNDAPKILALGVASTAATGLTHGSMYGLVAVAMGAGSVIGGLRVTRTLAERVTPIAPAAGVAANIVTSLLVGAASQFALPVSTTHVASGAIIGVGVSRGGEDVRWKTVGEVSLAWVVTLPASALLAAFAFRLLQAVV